MQPVQISHTEIPDSEQIPSSSTFTDALYLKVFCFPVGEVVQTGPESSNAPFFSVHSVTPIPSILSRGMIFLNKVLDFVINSFALTSFGASFFAISESLRI